MWNFCNHAFAMINFQLENQKITDQKYLSILVLIDHDCFICYFGTLKAKGKMKGREVVRQIVLWSDSVLVLLCVTDFKVCFNWFFFCIFIFSQMHADNWTKQA